MQTWGLSQQIVSQIYDLGTYNFTLYVSGSDITPCIKIAQPLSSLAVNKQNSMISHTSSSVNLSPIVVNNSLSLSSLIKPEKRGTLYN